MNKTIKEVLSGVAIGTANIIPGVSGGTFLLILGLYERVITALNGLSLTTIKELGSLKLAWLKKPTNREARQAFFAKVSELDLFFLMRIVGSAAIAIVLLSSLMEYLITYKYVPTYSYFTGLIIASILVPIRLLKKRTLLLFIPALLGIALTVSIAAGVNPYTKTMEKSSHYAKRAIDTSVTPEEVSRFDYKGIYTPREFIWIAITGAIAISAMVLPGVSGSLVLLLMGQYLAVLTAISGAKHLQIDQVLFLITFMIGMLVGLLLFVKLIDWFFKHHHDTTVGFLTGLIAGSLWALWPFKKMIAESHFLKDAQGIIIESFDPIVTNINILPTDVSSTILAIVFVGLGVVTMIPFLRKEA